MHQSSISESKITISNVNKFLPDLLMVLLTKITFFKNADKLMNKLLEILWGILKDTWIEHKFYIKSSISEIAK